MMNMINPRYSVIVLTAVIIVLTITVNNKEKNADYKLEVICTDMGWSYDILKNNKPFIHQNYIPAIEGNHPFPDKLSAKKTGQIVLKKLVNKESPGITKEELMNIIPEQLLAF